LAAATRAPRLSARAWIFAALAFALLTAVAPGQAKQRLRDLRYDTKGDHTRFVLEFSGLTPVSYQTRDEQATSGYYYIDFGGLDLAKLEPKNIRLDDQRVLSVLLRAYPEVGTARFVINTDGTKPVVLTAMTSPVRIIVDVWDVGKAPRSALVAPAPTRQASTAPPVLGSTARSAPQFRATSPAPAPITRDRKVSTGKRRPFLVVIDPGHGGNSKGAASRTKLGGRVWLEKELALAISMELKKLVDADPTLDTLMTRTNDAFLTLEERVQVAEQTRGDLFVSIHLNSIPLESPGSQAKGIEYYIADDRALGQLEARITRRTGGASVGTTVRKHAKLKVRDLLARSNAFARALEAECKKISYFRDKNRGIKRRNFYVLKNAYMPTLLLEVAFMSNTEDVRFISQKRNQQAVAKAIYNAIRTYRDENAP